MSSLGQVFGVLNRMRDEGVVVNYAVGGATAVLFYAEPTRTYDVDVFVVPAHGDRDALVSLAPIYDWARAQGFGVESEHHRHPRRAGSGAARVQRARDGGRRARQGLPVRRRSGAGGGPRIPHRLALQASGTRRRERAWTILETADVDRVRLREILARHAIEADIPDAH